jgi:hypothetical protein
MVVCDKRTDANPVTTAAQLVATTGVAVLPSFDVTRSLGIGREEWTRFARHWQHLAPDPYAGQLGVQRLRRYGQYSFRDGVLHPMPNRAFVQPESSNPLFVAKDRDFEPLTDEFATDPLLHKVIKLLARVAAALDDVADWNVKVHPFRIRCCADDPEAADGHPTPEDPHRDGVTLVSSLMLVGRRNASAARVRCATSIVGSGWRRRWPSPGHCSWAPTAAPCTAFRRSGRSVVTFASAWP